MSSSIEIAHLKAEQSRGQVQRVFSEFLQDDAGLISAVSDYTGHAFSYFQGPGPGKIWQVSRLLVHVEDAGGFDSVKYGNNITLTTGIEVGIFRGTVSSGASISISYLGGQAIKTNAQWGRYCYDISNVSFGVGNEFLQARWTFTNAGAPIVLRGDSLESLGVVFSGDDYSGLIDHNFVIQGIEFNA